MKEEEKKDVERPYGKKSPEAALAISYQTQDCSASPLTI